MTIKDWYKYSEDYKNIDDRESINENYDEFKEHRDDQSILSVLCKKREMINVGIDQTYFNGTCDYKIIKDNPIIAAKIRVKRVNLMN